MARRTSKRAATKKRTAQRIGVLLLILAVPLFIRAASPSSQDLRAMEPAQPPQDATLPPSQQTDAQAIAPPAGQDAQATPVSTPMPTAEPGTWKYETSKIQAYVKRYQQDDFVYFVADIQLTDPGQLSYAFSNEKYGAHTETLSDIAERHNPLLAINGDYYGFHDNGIIIRGGEVYRNQSSARHLMVVEANGDLTVVHDKAARREITADGLLARGALHTYEFGPVLVENGQAVPLESAILRVEDDYLEPRTAIGQLGPLRYIVIVVDGRSEGYSAGCNLATLQQLFLDHGAVTAFNLDGGGSTTLWFNGNVINQPASGDERKVSDIVMFMRE